MKYKVFIDGKEGTTGLRIYDRLANRSDIELMLIPEELRKDPKERAKYINSSDITFLCLPDQAAIEAVSLVTNDKVRIIDASTAHRTDPNWAYGFPELGQDFLEKIKKSNRVAVPGCYASGFMSIVYPLVKLGIAGVDYRDKKYDAPRLYAMNQSHKHLKEMQAIPGLSQKPLFNPYVCPFLEGMLVTVPLYLDGLEGEYSPKAIHDLLENYYSNQDFVRVMPFDEKGTEDGFLSANHLEGKDYLEIYVSGNEERINITACLDNLGKGASGAALECMNIMLGLDPKTSLNM